MNLGEKGQGFERLLRLNVDDEKAQALSYAVIVHKKGPCDQVKEVSLA